MLQARAKRRTLQSVHKALMAYTIGKTSYSSMPAIELNKLLLLAKAPAP
jgi:hypothetical protein